MKNPICFIILICITFLSFINCSKTTNYERGILTETGFESKYLNIRFTLPEGFLMATEEDMRTIMGIGSEVTGIDSNIANLTTVYEMMVSAPIGIPNVSLMAEKLLLSNMTVEQYFDSLKKILSNVETLNYEFDNQITSIEIAGQTYKQLSTSLPNFNIFQNYIFRKKGNRMIGFITIHSLDTKQDLEFLMSRFYKF